MSQYRYAWVIWGGVGDVIIFEHGCYISALAHIRMLIYIKHLDSSRVYKHNL